MAGTLYLVGTPIGNLGDLTERARQTLAAVDLVAAEDTRRTGRLLGGLGIKARMVSFFEGNEADRTHELVRVLSDGRDVAVVSDAGMPGLSDPGYRLVAACVEAGIAVDVVPGPSAVVSALVISGLPTDRFVFEGFLPRSGKARSQRLQALVGDPRTIVLFESPKRVEATLSDLLSACGDRRVAVVRELTKLHQEVLRGRLSEVLEQIGSRELKGEVVLVMEGGTDRPAGDEDEAVQLAASLVRGGARKREAARRISELTGVPAGRIYDGLVRSRG
ncbi:MAG TPA: 16S rRNA (cytidine(1402)-2'-O)-methyltransferase [Actinomycetota bacterium]|nr:16S rRNA (cytidine(1402)-2'-O)-methyltransferase [Actinomycetota bacterium]